MSELAINHNYTSPNYWPYNNGIAGIVLHGTDGDFARSIGWLCNPQSVVSANYIIDTDGSVYCIVDPYKNRSAWANGIPQLPDTNVPWIAYALGRGINLNTKTISIEHVASDYNMTHNVYASMPKAQRDSSLKLVLKLCADFGLKLVRNTIVGHYQIDKVDRPYCPGVINISDYVIELIKGVIEVSKGTTSNIDPFGDPSGWHCVIPGIDQWVVQPILDYWRKNGGLAEFGYPITGYRPATDNSGLYVQYFERTRLEFNPVTKEITRGRIGVELVTALGNKAV